MKRNRFASLSVLAFVALALACVQTPPLADTPENRLEQARALTAIEVEAGALDGMLDEGAALAREATADVLMLELEREPSEEDLATLEAVMRAGLAEFLTADLWQEIVAEVYAKNFTAAELQETVTVVDTLGAVARFLQGAAASGDRYAMSAADSQVAARLLLDILRRERGDGIRHIRELLGAIAGGDDNFLDGRIRGAGYKGSVCRDQRGK